MCDLEEGLGEGIIGDGPSSCCLLPLPKLRWESVAFSGRVLIRQNSQQYKASTLLAWQDVVIGNRSLQDVLLREVL